MVISEIIGASLYALLGSAYASWLTQEFDNYCNKRSLFDRSKCDHCGEKNIDPNELDESEKNLADIGGGYAHEYCMTEEQMKEYEAALCNESENDETDEELEQITNDDFEEENSKPEEETESIKRGWFDWTKCKEKVV